MESLKGLFHEKFIVDDREASFTFEIPGIAGEFSLFVPHPGPWKQVLILQLLQLLIQIVYAFIIYKAVVKRRGTISSFVIGWVLVMPASLFLPFYLLDALDIRNKVLCLSSSIASSIIFFRCIEAMYGTSPDFAELSLSNYCSYYGHLAPYLWNKKTKQIEGITRNQLGRSFLERLFNFTALSVVLSALKHFNFKPFEDPVELTSFTITLDLLSVGHFCNSYFIILLLYFTLNNLFEISAFFEHVKGLATEPLFDAPLTQSKTPTEFWTKRWNHMTHRLLKGGVFEPAKLTFSNKKVALFLTFVVSGLYHEYVWFTIFYDQKYLYDENGVCENEEDSYDFKFGRVTAFFAYAGLVMVLERPMRKLAFVKWLSSSLPTLVIAQLLVCTHAPLVKWYGGDWIAGGFFDDLALMFFLVKKK